MEKYTLTYSEDAKGWTSFFSFIPEQMLGMNGRFYSFKDGNLFRHNSETADRNNFYGEQDKSTIKGVLNQDPYNNKMFKTINLEGSDSWNCEIKTDMSEGEIKKDWFEKKENDYFGNIRRLETDQNMNMRSAQGLGEAIDVQGTDMSSIDICFGFNVNGIPSIGDIAFKLSDPETYTYKGEEKTKYNTITKLGKIKGKQDKFITIEAEVMPQINDYIVFIKNAVAESYGARGYYLEFDLENNSTTDVELFSIGATVFKSNP